jgi:Ni,Fe-hydrogenase I large subunit
MKRVVIDPVTRIEGHLRVETQIDGGIVTDARCSGDMFRGIEKALIGYDARVAQQVTQRVCGVCPYAHAEAAALALEQAMGLRPNENGQLLRNLIVGAYQLQDHLLHFYVLSALDFIDITAILNYSGSDAGLVTLRGWVRSELDSGKIFPAAPFLPRYEGAYAKDQELNISAIKGYLDALPIMADLHKMVAVFGAKAPHPVAIEAGGVTTLPTIERLNQYKTWLNRAAHFIRNQYRNDLLGVASAFPSYFNEGKGPGNFLTYPYFPDSSGEKHAFVGGATLGGKYQALDLSRITEDHAYSWYRDEPSSGIKPLQSTTLQPLDWNEYQREIARADGKYSWTRAPRYGGEVMEVGPTARVVNTYRSGQHADFNRQVDGINRELNIGLNEYDSVMGRHLSRLICALRILDRLEAQLEEVQPDKGAFLEREMPKNARGYGLTEATRGALGHWIETDDKGYIRNYELIVPTTWNMSPRDAAGKPGAVEQMLIGTKVADPAQPLELARIVRSTDPCMACSVH